MEPIASTAVDPRLALLRGIFSDRPQSPTPSLEEGKDRIHAAVSLILRAGPELEVLLIRRAEFDEDPWSGHMALPGGRREPQDPDLLATAIRETREETGVHLDGERGILGELPPLVPAIKRLPPLSIFPFVFGVGAETSARIASREVDEVLWTPLSTFLDPSANGTVTIQFGDSHRTFPCIRVGERVIWGLTYRIITGFLDEIRSREPGWFDPDPTFRRPPPTRL